MNAIIEHPPGAETQWDWLDLPDPPAGWGWGKTAHLLVGSLAHSGRWRAVLSPAMDQPHLIEGLDRVTRGPGGVTQAWRFDRMATVCHPDTGRVSASFAGVAKHYGVSVSIGPPRSGHRKGVVAPAETPASRPRRCRASGARSSKLEGRAPAKASRDRRSPSTPTSFSDRWPIEALAFLPDVRTVNRPHRQLAGRHPAVTRWRREGKGPVC